MRVLFKKINIPVFIASLFPTQVFAGEMEAINTISIILGVGLLIQFFVMCIGMYFLIIKGFKDIFFYIAISLIGWGVGFVVASVLANFIFEVELFLGSSLVSIIALIISISYVLSERKYRVKCTPTM